VLFRTVESGRSESTTRTSKSCCCATFATCLTNSTSTRLASAVIVENLNLLPHGLWSDWRGKQDTDTPHPITAGVVAKLLAPFRIKPATIWPLHRTTDTKSSRGYHRHQFETAWAKYCPAADTPTHSGKIKALGRH
jgi:hypothetical protein